MAMDTTLLQLETCERTVESRQRPSPQDREEMLTMVGNAEGSTFQNLTSVVINSSTGVNVGDTFFRQTVVNREVVKAKLLCLHFESTVSMKRFRCSLAVFLCWSVLAAISVTAYIIIYVIPQHRTRMEIDLKAPWYIRRMEWLALAAHDPEFLRLPIKQVLIDQAECGYCNRRHTCSEAVMYVQDSQLHRGFPDIAANFLVGGNGWVFEGTGANVRSFFRRGWDGDDKSIVIMFIGDYTIDQPDQKQFDHVSILLEVLVHSGVLSEDYELYGTCQIDTYTDNPGPKLMKRLHRFSHWNSTNEETCLPGLPY